VTFDPELLDMMPDTVTYEPFSSFSDSAGDKSYGAAQTIRARIEQYAKLIRDRQGREVTSQTRIYLPPTDVAGAAFTPTVNDRFTLPSGYVPQQPQVIDVERGNDNQSLQHWQVSF